MIGGSEVNPDQYKQQAQYLNLRGTQMAQDQVGTAPGGAKKAKAPGAKKQLIGTVVGILVVIGVLVLWSVFH